MGVPQIVSFVLFGLQLIVSAITGLIGWGIKNSSGRVEMALKQNAQDIQLARAEAKENDAKRAAEIKELAEKHDAQKQKFNDFKSDAPLVFVLQEEFVRTMNGVDKSMRRVEDKIDTMTEKVLLAINSNGEG